MKQIEFERWEPDAENPRKLKYAGQRKADTAVHPAHRLVFLGGVVLDGLRLVEDAGVKLLSLVKRLVTPQ